MTYTSILHFLFRIFIISAIHLSYFAISDTILPIKTAAIVQQIGKVHQYDEVILVHTTISTTYFHQLRLTLITMTEGLHRFLSSNQHTPRHRHDQTASQQQLQSLYADLGAWNIHFANVFTHKAAKGQGKFVFHKQTDTPHYSREEIADEITLKSSFDFLWFSDCEHLLNEIDTQLYLDTLNDLEFLHQSDETDYDKIFDLTNLLMSWSETALQAAKAAWSVMQYEDPVSDNALYTKLKLSAAGALLLNKLQLLDSYQPNTFQKIIFINSTTYSIEEYGKVFFTFAIPILQSPFNLSFVSPIPFHLNHNIYG